MLRRHLNITDKGKVHFAVIGEEGAAHFWRQSTNPDCFVGFHITQPADPDKGDAHNCWLTGRPCEHQFDQTGTDAQDRWSPIYDECNKTGDFNPLFELLEQEYITKFGE